MCLIALVLHGKCSKFHFPPSLVVFDGIMLHGINFHVTTRFSLIFSFSIDPILRGFFYFHVRGVRITTWGLATGGRDKYVEIFTSYKNF